MDCCKQWLMESPRRSTISVANLVSISIPFESSTIETSLNNEVECDATTIGINTADVYNAPIQTGGGNKVEEHKKLKKVIAITAVLILLICIWIASIKYYVKENYAKLAYYCVKPPKTLNTQHLNKLYTIDSSPIRDESVELFKAELSSMGRCKNDSELEAEVVKAKKEAERIQTLEGEIHIIKTLKDGVKPQTDENKENRSSEREMVLLRFDGIGSDIRSNRFTTYAKEYGAQNLRTIMMRPRLWDAGENSKFKDDSPNALTLKNDVQDFVNHLVKDPELAGAKFYVHGYSFGCYFATLATYFLMKAGIVVETLGLECPFHNMVQASEDTTIPIASVLRVAALGNLRKIIPNTPLCSLEVAFKAILSANEARENKTVVTIWESSEDKWVGQGGTKLIRRVDPPMRQSIRHFLIPNTNHVNHSTVDTNYYQRWKSETSPSTKSDGEVVRSIITD